MLQVQARAAQGWRLVVSHLRERGEEREEKEVSITSPYRIIDPAPEPERDVWEMHVSNVADYVLIAQEKYGWKLTKVERIAGPLDQPVPWWATKEWRGSHVRLHFERRR